MIAKTFPLARVRSVLAATETARLRQRDLPAHVVVYDVIALGLSMQASNRAVLRCLVDGIQGLLDPFVALTVAGTSGLLQARTWLGWKPLSEVHDAVVTRLPFGRPRAPSPVAGG